MHKPTPSPTASPTVLLLFFGNVSVFGGRVVPPGEVVVVVVGWTHAATPNVVASVFDVYEHAQVDVVSLDATHEQSLCACTALAVHAGCEHVYPALLMRSMPTVQTPVDEQNASLESKSLSMSEVENKSQPIAELVEKPSTVGHTVCASHCCSGDCPVDGAVVVGGVGAAVVDCTHDAMPNTLASVMSVYEHAQICVTVDWVPHVHGDGLATAVEVHADCWHLYGACVIRSKPVVHSLTAEQNENDDSTSLSISNTVNNSQPIAVLVAKPWMLGHACESHCCSSLCGGGVGGGGVGGCTHCATPPNCALVMSV
jgi:hypothetical protein